MPLAEPHDAARANAHPREALLLPLVRQGLQSPALPQPAPEGAHGGAAVPVHRLWPSLPRRIRAVQPQETAPGRRGPRAAARLPSLWIGLQGQRRSNKAPPDPHGGETARLPSVRSEIPASDRGQASRTTHSRRASPVD